MVSKFAGNFIKAKFEMFKFTGLLGIAIMIALIYYACSARIFFENKYQNDRFILATTQIPAHQQKAEEFQRVEKIKFYGDQAGVLRSVAQGQADAGIIDSLVALHLIYKMPEFRNIRLAGNLLHQEPVGVAFNHYDDSLRQAINRGLSGIIENGIYESISKRYFGRDIGAGLKSAPTYPEDTPADDASWKKRRLANELRFAMSGDNPPFSYLDERNQLTGFDVELALEVCIQLGVENFTPVLVAPEDLLTGLTAGHYDGIWNSMRITEENLAIVDFSNPYYVTGAQLVVPANSPIIGPETLVPPVFPEPPPMEKN